MIRLLSVLSSALASAQSPTLPQDAIGMAPPVRTPVGHKIRPRTEDDSMEMSKRATSATYVKCRIYMTVIQAEDQDGR